MQEGGAGVKAGWKREEEGEEESESSEPFSIGFSGPVAPTGKRLQPNWTATGSNWTSSCSWGPEFH